MTTTLFGHGDDEWPKLPQTPACHHRMDPVVMPDGVTFYASASHTLRDEGEMHPDFGFYLDSVWKPDCIAFYAHWQDFGIPTLPLDKFIEMLEFVYDYARDYAVEVGCIGGHGRTGTALACLAVVGGALTPQTAIDLVRDTYCFKAVETEEQEWLVEAVFATRHGLEVPEKPEPPKYKTGSGAGAIDWKEMGRTEKGENKGIDAKVSTDASGQEYCSACLVDIPSPDTMICVWCEANLKSGD